MDDLHSLREWLRSLSLSALDAVAAEAGVPRSTARKVAYGHVTDPRFSTVARLRAVKAAREAAAA